MGVQGLWDLVAPAGRRVKIGTLEGKVLAIDVSIWLLRILHGHISVGKNEFSNVHLIGVLKRIIKLMFYGIKPVFVFDGKFPELKKETVYARQQMREHRKRNLKKIAEKYLTKVLEQKIKENIRGKLLDKNSNRNSDNFVQSNRIEEDEEEEQYFDDNEENKQARKQKKKSQKMKEKEENAKDSEDEADAMLYDYEFDLIIEENKEMLIESGIDMEEFWKQDQSKQYNTIKKFRNNMRERKMKKYLAIDSLDEFSKIHISDYVKHCKRKHQAEKNKANDQIKKMNEQQEAILGNVKYNDFISNEYMRNLFLDPRKNVVQKTLVSNRNKGFIYMERQEKRNENHMLKLGNKKQSKYEKQRKLNQKLKEILQNSEVGHQLFSFEEMLADNPLDAFKYHAQKIDVIPQRDGVNEAALNDKDEGLSGQIDVDEVFGFDEWEETTKAERSEALSEVKENTNKIQTDKETMQKIQETNQNKSFQNQSEAESNEDFTDLFEYKIEEDNNNEIKEEEIKNPKKVVNSKEKKGREGIMKIAQELETRERHMQEIFAHEKNLKENSTIKVNKFEEIHLDKNKRLFEFDPNEVYDNQQENDNEDSKASPVKKVVKNNVKEIIVEKDVKQSLFERIEARTLNKVDSFHENKEFLGSVEKENSTFSLFNEKPYRNQLETPAYDHSFSISTKDTETKINLTGSQMFAERENYITKTVNKWLGLIDGKDSAATVKGKKTNLSISIENAETEKKNKTQEKAIEEFLKEPEVKEGEQLKPSSPSYFKKVQIDDLYEKDETADYFWKEPKKENGSNSKKDSVSLKEEVLKIEEKEEIGEITEISYLKLSPRPTNKNKLKEKKKEEETKTKIEEEIKQEIKKEEIRSPELQSIKEVPQEANQNSNGFSPSSQENWEDLDEEGLLAKMKELEEDDVTDKWALMEQFQKFQNLQELEGGSIQDKLREIKEMLIMFGIPWVDSPAEAEAQCSFLELNGLVDGVITDDSDVFLFGARHVYRNMFDKGDFAHSYHMRSIEGDLGLDRTKLILLALFLGSDYTLGIKGVGIVNAMEIVGAFETFESLERFKTWAEMPDVFMDDPSTHYKNIPAKELQYKLNHRNYKKHWELPSNFPDARVVEAYEKPHVDQSLEKFEWGTPDVETIENVCKTRFKWDEERINNTLDPLKKAMKERKGQKRITDFFREEKFAQINSKRLNETIKGLQNKENSNDIAEFSEEIERKIQRQNVNKLKRQPDVEQNKQLNDFAFKKKKPKKPLQI